MNLIILTTFAILIAIAFVATAIVIRPLAGSVDAEVAFHKAAAKREGDALYGAR